MTLALLGRQGVSWLGLAAAAPAVGSGGLRDALRWLPDVPDGDWPCLLLGACAGILGLLALWGLGKALLSVRRPRPIERKEEGRDKGRLPFESRRTPMLLEETKAPFVIESPPRGTGSGVRGRARSFWGRLLTALLRALAIPGA